LKRIVIETCRLHAEIDSLAAISEASAPVVTRVLFSEADLRGRAYVKNLCKEAGLSMWWDAVGNLFARWKGSEPQKAGIATGSHIDAIPNAGRYDGVVGVLGAIEAIRALQRSGFRPRRSIDLIVFTAEEPTRFGIGCLGSRLLSGSLPLKKAQALRDRDGHDLNYWRRKGGVSNQRLETVRLKRNCYDAFVELHIEQGPLLENERIPIGIVERIAAPSTLRMELIGVGGHAGAVLMPQRRDALVAAAEIVIAVEKAACTSGSPDTVGTTGVLRIEPGAVNSVPCRAWMEIDLRDTRLATRDASLKKIEEAAKKICRTRRIKLRVERLNVDSPAICAPQLVNTVAEVCKKLELPVKRMVSRAYHDSLFMAQVCATTMIFIPCRGGVSHRPDEFSSPSQIKKGVEVLAHTLAHLAG
jgi:N-carbamoyl-L-amino-acid hydrolase